MLVLPIVLDGIFGIEPRSIKHLIYIVVIPLLHLIQFVLDYAHPVEDEEHMKLWITLEVVVYSILYHNIKYQSICSEAIMKERTLPLNLARRSNRTSEIINVVLNERLVATLKRLSSRAKLEPPAGR